MYPYILCFCGKALGNIYDIFKLMRAEKYAHIDECMDTFLLSITNDFKISLEDIFEQLNVPLECCRVRLNTQVEFKELY